VGAVIRNRTQHHRRVSWRVRRANHKRLKYPVLTPSPGYQTSNASFWHVTTVLDCLGEANLQSRLSEIKYPILIRNSGSQFLPVCTRTGSLPVLSWNPMVIGGSGRGFFIPHPPNLAILCKYSEPGVMIQIKEPAHTVFYVINWWFFFF
jgi:hypothetical protein